MVISEQHYWAELKKHISRILDSPAKYKLIVSGPGTGKTYLFKKAIEHYKGTRDDYLVITFINNLVRDLEEIIGNSARVYTFHGYCHYLLRKYPYLSKHLEADFEYYPPIIRIIKSDWQNHHDSDPPQFIDLMRNLQIGEELRFYTAPL